MPNLSRRHLVASAAALPALALPAAAHASCTLPPDLIERFLRERWDVAEAMMAHEPQSIVDVAWQLEAWLIADLELFNSSSDRLFRTLVGYVRTLGAVPQPDDPFGALSLADCEA